MTSLSVVMRTRNGELEAEVMSPVDLTSSGDDSDERNRHEVPSLPRKKQKSTYYSRKDEIHSLQIEQEKLAKEIERLNQRQNSTEANKLQYTLEQHATLHHAVHQGFMATAGARSLLNSATAINNPLRTYIHLTTDAAQREATLESVHVPHTNKGIAYLLERARFQNLHRATRQNDVVEAENGDVVYNSFDVTSFADTKCTLAQLYDEMIWLTRHQEFVMFDNFGVSSFLEVDTSDEEMPATSHVRILSTIVDDLVMEKNLVVLRSFNPQGSDALPVPHAIIAIESIDQDDLYPYQSESRARLDLSCFMLLVSVPPVDKGTSDGMPTVSVLHAAFKRLFKPEFPCTMDQETCMRDMVVKWGEVLCKTARANILMKTRG